MVAVFKFLLLALTATATPLLHRDVVTVQNDITQKIHPQVSTLNKDVNGFPASGLTGAVTINADANQLVAIVNTAISNVKSTGSFGTVSGTTILAQIQVGIPTLLATLAAIGAQEPSWAAIPGGRALVLNLLQALNTAFSNYLDAITAAEPLLLKAGAVAVKTQVSGAFSSTIARYS